MQVLIRTDATLASGTGHVMRCAALGMRLQARGGTIHFACAALPAGLHEWLISRDLKVHMLDDLTPGDVAVDLQKSVNLARCVGPIDLLVVDHYGLGRDWEQGMRPCANRILVIDDLANRDHDCDALLDQNLRDAAELRYAALLPPGAKQFIGPHFALLREEFDEPSLTRQRDGQVRKLLVFFGGTDPGNQSLKVIDALRLLGDLVPATTLVLGPVHPDRELAHARAAGLPHLKVLDATDRMSALMSQADLAIGTCGVAAWERCAVGLPSLVVVTAENQREDAEILHRLGAVVNLDDAANTSAKDLADCLCHLIGQPERIKAMGSAAASVMQGRKAAFAEFEAALLAGFE